MKSSARFASFAIVAGMFSVAGLTGARATTVNCAAGQTIGAAIGTLKPSTGYQTIDVSKSEIGCLTIGGK